MITAFTRLRFEATAKAVSDKMTGNLSAFDFIYEMMDHMNLPLFSRQRIYGEIWAWIRDDNFLSTLGLSKVTTAYGGIFAKGVKRNPSTTEPLINNATCPHCKNERCNRIEKSCWKCGGELPLQ